MKTRKRILTAGSIVLVVLLGIAIITHSCRKRENKINIQTVKATRGTVINTVTATGTIQAIKTVNVGTQVSGVIDKIYVDFNSHVKKGQILAELDKTPLEASLENAKASLDNATAQLTYQKSNYDRIKALYDKKLVAQADYDLALYNFSTAEANLKIAQSGYDKAKINLDYATIYSPIDGVVLERAVDEGQTVAASFNTPTLFIIANDLTQMQVEADIDEADIGQVKNGQEVTFNVDAYPDQNFEGKVTQIRLQPVTTSNVVTYTVIVYAPNPGEKLMPGMTANITVDVQEADNVITVPAKVVHFGPDSTLLMAYLQSLPDSLKNKFHPGEKHGQEFAGRSFSNTANSGNSDFSRIWVKNGLLIHPVRVETGVTDGMITEIKSGLKEGEEVVSSITSDGGSVDTKQAEARSPFMPHRPSSNKK